MLLKDLLTILSGDEPLQDLGAGFLKMLELSEEMFREVNGAVWRGQVPESLKKKTYQRDVQLNKLERGVRREVLSHLAAQASPSGDLPYCFVLIHVVKDAERIGDYVKNLAEILELGPIPVEPAIRAELERLGAACDTLLRRVGPVFKASDDREAAGLVRQGRELARGAERVITQIAAAGLDGRSTAVAVLMARYYKRIIAHTSNILSSVIMPLHKIDFFDEEELAKV